MPRPRKPRPQLKLERRRIDSLRLDPHNARRHPQANLDALAASLERYGQVRPVVIDATGMLRAGEGVYLAAQVLGWTELDVVVSGLTEAELRAYAVADNRTAELSTWDERQLAGTLLEIESEGTVSLDATAFSRAELDQLLGRLVDEIEAAAPVVVQGGGGGPPAEDPSCPACGAPRSAWLRDPPAAP